MYLLSTPMAISDHDWGNDTSPLVSISCSTYNHENFIRDAIGGFLMQKTTFPVEILIHDDASTDHTADIVKEYEAKYPQLFHCFYQPENTYTKQNKGELRKPFRSARRGKYIAICEGDDYWTDPLKLQKQVDFLEANPEHSMCFHNAQILDNEKILKGERIFENLRDKDYDGKEILTNWIVPTASVIYRNEYSTAIRKLPKHPDYMYGDIILFLSLAEFGKIRCINQKMSVYRIHRDGLRTKHQADKKERFIKHQLAIQNGFGGKYRYLTNTIIARYHFELASKQSKKKNFNAAISNVTKGVYRLMALILFRPSHFLKKLLETSRK
jgi:glycosyltransferase involved in cell wall biosynthesis